MQVLKRLVPVFKHNIKCPYPMDPEFYVVHNTYNDATALNEIAYMTNNDKQTSFHYAIDNNHIVQGIEENRNGWHAGDGANGVGNRKGIGVEICYSKSGGARFVEAERLAAKFIAKGLSDKGWGIDKVKKHQDFSGKYCPHRTLGMGWDRFLKMIEAEMEPEYVKILKAKTDSPKVWIDFIQANKNHPVGKWLPDLIVKLSQK
ncbi:MAG: N-acetylmuramoyl-L-alanine amidase [Dethiosulfatibacter sp.]|nr:N-acetylmuramoyl-L-alanine amidase [Dethiosulfatibacter sp.]